MRKGFGLSDILINTAEMIVTTAICAFCFKTVTEEVKNDIRIKKNTKELKKEVKEAMKNMEEEEENI